MNLVFPAERYRDEWYDILDEIENAGETIVPYSLKMETDDYDAYLRIINDFSNGVNLNGWVPADTFFLVDGENPRILGAVSIRYALNNYLFNFGGHIGYGVRPSERRKGCAAEMLRLALEVCRSKNMEKVLICCYKDNIASARTMLKNGAVLENEVREDDKTVQRYWIRL